MAGLRGSLLGLWGPRASCSECPAASCSGMAASRVLSCCLRRAVRGLSELGVCGGRFCTPRGIHEWGSAADERHGGDLPATVVDISFSHRSTWSQCDSHYPSLKRRRSAWLLGGTYATMFWGMQAHGMPNTIVQMHVKTELHLLALMSF